MPRSKLSAFKQQLCAAEEDVQLKTQQLAELKEQVSQARAKITKLESEVNSNAALEDDVQVLLRHQQETAAAFTDYENRVLALELQGLVDRWRTMDIEELSQQNHDLREECLRLQQENMELSRAVTEQSLSARRDLAKIEMALELTVKEKMREMHDRLRQELYGELDDKTKKMVAEHGYLQDYVRDQASQAATLDRHCRTLQADRNRLKVDSDVATSLSEQQATQAVTLRRQLKQAYQTVEALRRRLVESETRAQAAWDEAVRASSRAAVAAAAAARAGLHGQQPEVDGDSAFGMAGEGAEIAALESQLRHAKQRFERMRLQRDRWRDRSLLYEKACAQLQAALQTLQDQARLTLPGGVKQDLDAIWCAAKAASAPDADTAGSGVASSRQSTSQLSSEATSPKGVGGGGGGAWGGDSAAARGSTHGSGGRGGGAGWAAEAGAMAAGAGRIRAASARVANGRSRGLPLRPQTALPLAAGGGGAAAAARRAAEATRVALNVPSPLPPAAAAATGGAPPGSGGDRRNGGASGSGAAGAPVPAWADEGEPLAPRGSVSPPGRMPASRLYSSEAEPYRVVPRILYDQPGWPTGAEFRSRSPNNGGPATTIAGSSLRPLTAQSGPLHSPSPLASMTALPPGPRRCPGSMRPHSALPTDTSFSCAPSSRWTPGKSLTGLTAAPDTPAGPDTVPSTGASGTGGGDSNTAEAPAASDRPEARGAGVDTSQQQKQQQQPPSSVQPRRLTSGHLCDGSGSLPLTPSRSAGMPRTVQQAAESDWQSWQAQRERSQSPELAAIARAAAASAAAAAAEGAGSGCRAHAASDRELEALAERYGAAAAAAVAATSPAAGGTAALAAASAAAAAAATAPAARSAVPEVGLSGGALYTAVHALAASIGGDGGASATTPTPTTHSISHPLNSLNGALLPGVTAAGGAGTGASASGLHSPYSHAAGSTAFPPASSPAAAITTAAPPSSSTFRPPHLQVNLGGQVNPSAPTNPSNVLAALRRTSHNSSFKRLHNPDVLFTGVRAASARPGGGTGATGGSGSARGLGEMRGGAGGTGGGNGSSQANSTGSIGPGL